MTILVDADDVMWELVDHWVDVLNEKYGARVSPAEIIDWDITKFFPGLTYSQVFDVLSEPGFWDGVTPTPGSRETLEKLIQEGNEVYVVTSTYYTHAAEKIKKLLELFPFIDYNHVVITHNKQMIRGDVLIDDAPHNLVNGDYFGILFDRPHSRSFNERDRNILRVRTWDEIYGAVNIYKSMKKEELYGCS